jgi:hypothetical protein
MAFDQWQVVLEFTHVECVIVVHGIGTMAQGDGGTGSM